MHAPRSRDRVPLTLAGVLQDSWLLKGARQKFLDGLLASARVEHIMPKVEIVSEGDQVNEVGREPRGGRGTLWAGGAAWNERGAAPSKAWPRPPGWRRCMHLLRSQAGGSHAAAALNPARS